jgi:phage host-nuclease inhibitor protein Gam
MGNRNATTKQFFNPARRPAKGERAMSTQNLFCQTKPAYQTQNPAPHPTTKRSRPRAHAAPDLQTWDHVNERLGLLGEIDRQLRVLRDDFEQKVAVLKQQWLESSRPIEKERDRVQGQIERFYWTQHEELRAQGRKSVELAFGRLGSRLSRSVVVEDPALAQQWLEAHGIERFLRTRTEVDREAIRSTLLSASGLGDSVSHALLACPAIRFEESEQFWCTLLQSPAESVPPESPGHWRRGSQAETSPIVPKSRRKRLRCLDPNPVLPDLVARGGAQGGIQGGTNDQAAL